MKKPFSYILLLLLALAASCRTEVPEPKAGPTGRPYLFISGTLDNRPISFAAGVENHYNHTGLEKDDFNVYESSSSIKLEPCDGCHNYLEIILRDRTTSVGDEQQDPDSVFQITNYPFQFGAINGGSNLIRMQLEQRNPDGPQVLTQQWTVRDSLSNSILAQSNLSTPEFILPAGAYFVELISSFNTGCTDTVNQRVMATLTPPACNTAITVTRVPGTSLVFLDTANVTVDNPTAVIWTIDNMTFTGGSLMFVPDSFGLAQVFDVKLEVLGASCTAVIEERVSTNPLSFCVANFGVAAFASVDPLQLGHARLLWKDENGWTYGSTFGEQPNWARFELVNTDTFSMDRAGNKTIVADGFVDCRLFLPDGSAYKELRNTQFKLSFPYKGP